MDTGRLIKGRIIDIFMRDRKSAIEFGRRTVKLTLLRYGFGSKGGRASSRTREIG
jgi:hypothetical protein